MQTLKQEKGNPIASTPDSEIAVLNDLIAVTLDSVKGYEDAAGQAHWESLKSLLTHYAIERREVIRDLQEMVRARGGTPEEEARLLSKMHRMFLHLKTIVASQDDTAVLEEVERGEAYLKQHWEYTLEQIPPGAFHTAVSRCFTPVKAALHNLSALKHPAEGPNVRGREENT